MMGMKPIAVTYTVRAVSRELHHDGKGVAERATLSLDAQPGGPIWQWGNMPRSISLMNADCELGQSLRLTIEECGL